MSASVEGTSERALRIARETRNEFREALGKPPNAAIRDDTGTGIWKVLHTMQTTIDEIKRELAEERVWREKRNGAASRLGWIVVQTAATAAVLAMIAWLAGFHR